MEEPNIIICSEENGTGGVSLLDYNFNKRNIIIEGDLSGEYCDSIQRQLIAVCEGEHEPDEVITIFINGHGGELSNGLNLYQAIRNCPYKVRTVNMGTCSSLHALIFLAGDIRISLPYSRLLFHEPVFETKNQKSLSELRMRVKEMEVYQNYIINIVSDRCNQPKTRVRKLIDGRDLILDAEDALVFGAVTEILERMY